MKKNNLTFEILENKNLLAVLLDPNIREYVNSRYDDNYLNRQEILNVLNIVFAKNVVTKEQINDLNTLAKTDSYKEDPYAKILLGNMLSSPANNGKDLKVGSVNSDTFRLMSKWFYGKDRPTLPNYDIQYAYVNGNAVVNGTSSQDVRQGYLGDCWFLASLSAVADKTGVNNFVYNGDETWTFWFYRFNDGKSTMDAVTVDRYLPVWRNSGNAVFASFGGKYNNPNNELWVALEEKAYAQYNQTGYTGRQPANDYIKALNGGLSVTDQITGQPLSQNWNVSYGEYAVQTALKNGDYVVIYRWMDAQRSSGHAYSIKSYQNGTYQLINPWGYANLNLTWSQIKNECFGFAIGKKATPNTRTISPKVSAFANVIIELKK